MHAPGFSFAPAINTFCNIIWLLVAGIWMGLSWCLFGALCFISLIGIPWGRACFVIAGFAFWPFGRMPIARNVLIGHKDLGTGKSGMVGNIIWLLCCGLWLALQHLAWALCLAITVVGLPFAWQLVKLGALALSPIGKTIVSVQVAKAAQLRYATRFGCLPAPYSR